MEFLVGESLRSCIARAAPLPIESCLAIGFQLAESLSLAHKHGIVHRDLKPDNVMLIEDATAPKGQRAKVFDFGIAKSISELGKDPRRRQDLDGRHPRHAPRYMSRTVPWGRDEDRRSIGCVFPGDHALRRDGGWRTPPFDGSAPGDPIAQHIVDAPPNLRDAAPAAPAGSRDADPACWKKKPQDRPTMQQVARGMKAILDGQPTLQSRIPQCTDANGRRGAAAQDDEGAGLASAGPAHAFWAWCSLGLPPSPYGRVAAARRSPSHGVDRQSVGCRRACDRAGGGQTAAACRPTENAAPVAGTSDAESTAAGANRVARPKPLPHVTPEKPKVRRAKESKEILNVPGAALAAYRTRRAALCALALHPKAEGRPTPVSGRASLDDAPAASLSAPALVARGTERFRRGNYDGAIADFYAAYERQQVPTLLFNIAQAHRKSGRGQDALTVFEQFKLADPKSSLLPEVDAYIAELKAKQEAERAIAERDRTELLARVAEQRAGGRGTGQGPGRGATAQRATGTTAGAAAATAFVQAGVVLGSSPRVGSAR